MCVFRRKWFYTQVTNYHAYFVSPAQCAHICTFMSELVVHCENSTPKGCHVCKCRIKIWSQSAYMRVDYPCTCGFGKKKCICENISLPSVMYSVAKAFRIFTKYISINTTRKRKYIAGGWCNQRNLVQSLSEIKEVLYDSSTKLEEYFEIAPE